MSRGNGYLNTNGTTDVAVGTWSQSMAAFAVRGRSYKDSDYIPGTTVRNENGEVEVNYVEAHTVS